MKRIVIIFVALVSSMIISSCTKVIDVNIDSENDRLVIEGLVTNRLQPFSVKLSKTLTLPDSSNFPVVNNAFVTISDNVGNIDTLPLVGNGVYKTKVSRQGVVGRTYTMSVTVDGSTYIGQDILTSVSPIDTMYCLYLKKGDALGITEDGYYVYFNSTDPPNEKNFYFEEAYRNGTYVVRSNQLNISDDKFLAPVILGARVPGRYDSGEKVTFVLSSLSEAGYNYLNGVLLQLQNDGGFFSTPPANAPNNLSGGALGFFRASSQSIDSLIVP